MQKSTKKIGGKKSDAALPNTYLYIWFYLSTQKSQNWRMVDAVCTTCDRKKQVNIIIIINLFEKYSQEIS